MQRLAGIANYRALSVEANFDEDEEGVEVTLKKKGGAGLSTSTSKKGTQRVVRAVERQAHGYRPDLVKPAKAAASSAAASLRRHRAKAAE